MEESNISQQTNERKLVKNSFCYYHTSQSIRSRLLKLFFRLSGAKKATSRTLDQMNLERFNVRQPPKSFFTRFKITRQVYNGSNVFTLSLPKADSSKPVILLLHGGAYIISFTLAHWILIRYLINKTGCTVVAPDYPLSPLGTYKHRLDMIEHLYDDMLKTYAPEQIVFVGDSSGGNLALVLAQQLHLQNKPQPAQMILVSPWLDVSMSNPGMVESNKRDPYLSLDPANYLGRMHAGDLDTKDPLVSPMYGSIQGLKNISIFTSTSDLLNPDAKLFKERADKEKVGVNYYEYQHMVHDWILFPIPEADKAKKQIAELINKNQVNNNTLESK